MTSLSRLFRNFVNLLRQPETEVPYPEEPLPVTPPPELPPEEELSMYGLARRERHGPAPLYVMKLTKTYRFTEFIQGDVSKVYVPPDKSLSYEAHIIAADGKRYEIAGSLKSGEQWTKERQNRKFAANLKSLNGEIEKPSEYLKDATIQVNWYINKWTPESELVPQ
jgi:hypothetical protein